MDIMKTIKEWWMTGALVGVFTVILSKYYAKFLGTLTLKLATPDITLNVRQRILQGLDTSIGDKLWGYFNGFLPIQGMNVWLIAAITGVAFAVIGRLIYGLEIIPKDFFGLDASKHKVAIVMFWGALAFGLYYGSVVPSFTVDFVANIVVLLLYWLIAAFGAQLLIKNALGMDNPE